jgi:hypothetical protein
MWTAHVTRSYGSEAIALAIALVRLCLGLAHERVPQVPTDHQVDEPCLQFTSLE